MLLRYWTAWSIADFLVLTNSKPHFGDSQVLDSVESDEELQADLASVLVIPVAQYGHSHLVPLLTDYGADLAETDPSRGGPPLMHAANNGHAGTVTALLRVNLLCCFLSLHHCLSGCFQCQHRAVKHQSSPATCALWAQSFRMSSHHHLTVGADMQHVLQEKSTHV